MKIKAVLIASVILCAELLMLRAGPPSEMSMSLDPARLPCIGQIEERYQSYKVEMPEVTGGKFWRPYGPDLEAALKTSPPKAAPSESGDTPAGMNPAVYQYRPPIDLTNARLRRLAGALGPAYVRVSGTWANTNYFPEDDSSSQEPPAGFNGVLTHAQWKGVVDFSKAFDAEIVTSFATSVGTGNADGVWNTDQAKRFLDYTQSVGGEIIAEEHVNEPSFAAMGGAPKGYDAADYGRDFKVFAAFAIQARPSMLILGPGSVGETTGDWSVSYGMNQVLSTPEMLKASEPVQVDRFSYHHYGASSQRCAAMGMPGTTSEDALSEQWLHRTDETLAFYRKQSDQFEPGKPFWLTEVADAACGGNPWGASFLDTFRHLDQLGRLAKQDVQVLIHNTLLASDYDLLDDKTLIPKPNYWGALGWRKMMGIIVLDSGVPIQEGAHVYAHSLRGHAGGVALLVINNNRTKTTALNLPLPAERYTLTAPNLEGKKVELNGNELKLGADDELPNLAGTPIPAGQAEFAPASITFLAVADTKNPASQ